MRRKIPSSAALLAFEAAARHGNFARAAAELALTEGAISRQIARLEALLDSKLFDRTGSRVRLNPAGAAMLVRSARSSLAWNGTPMTSAGCPSMAAVWRSPCSPPSPAAG
ncbi:glycine cleavage system transcriptional activator [Klebsiella pneumoniae]|nr:glycine cleavage system transcriptional activator [Klebsiella pneumoniae]SVR62115.1 glycine cleavage system transcriptional activator [Klebsiella pneumoniae]